MSKYDDIINLPRPISKKHKPMSLLNRAAQFAPFAALTGYDEVIDEAGRFTDDKVELDDYEINDINNILLYLVDNRQVVASYTYFVKDKRKKGGAYINAIGSIVKNDIDNHRIKLSDGTTINTPDIVKIEIVWIILVEYTFTYSNRIYWYKGV